MPSPRFSQQAIQIAAYFDTFQATYTSRAIVTVLCTFTPPSQLGLLMSRKPFMGMVLGVKDRVDNQMYGFYGIFMAKAVMSASNGSSAARTPAPARERIKGSKVNAPGSAASEAKASGITLSDEIIQGLRRKMEEYNDKHPGNKVSLAVLKAVFRRGAGAYSSSHRPTIRGGRPNSRTAWAYARVNAFLRKKSGGDAKKSYVQDDDLMAEGGHTDMLLAPNGKPSNLTPEQYHLVRTPAFKAWFGDWENDPENASKVIDDNGEPLVVYHGTSRYFSIFKYGQFGFHFGTKRQAEYIVKEAEILNWYFTIIPAFLNIRNLVKLEDRIKWTAFNITKSLAYKGYIKKLDSKESDNFRTNEIKKMLIKKYGIDGIYYINKVEGKGISFIAFNSEQIKLADGSNTTFGPENPDIRYSDGGEVSNSVEAIRTIAIQQFTDAGYDLTKGSLSNTDYGTSAYFYVNYQDRAIYTPGIKIRVSDHSVTNPYRMSDEIHIYRKDDIKKAIHQVDRLLRPELFDIVENVVQKKEQRIVIEGVPQGNDIPENYYNPATDIILENLGLSKNGRQKYLVERNQEKIVKEYIRKDTDVEYAKGGKTLGSELVRKNLVVYHNINENNIRDAVKLGGLVTPSIAIVKAGDSFTEFGTITLIGTKELINPENRDVKVYAGDVYSPTVPPKLYYVDKKRLDRKTQELINKAYAYDQAAKYPENVFFNKLQNDIGPHTDFERTINRNSLDRIVSMVYDDLKAAYIVEKNIPVKVPMQDRRHYLWNNVEFKITSEQKKRFAPILKAYTKESNEKGSMGVSNETMSAVYDLFMEVLEGIRENYKKKYSDRGEDGETLYKIMTEGLQESFEKYVGTRYNWSSHAEYKLSQAVWDKQEVNQIKLNDNINKVFTKQVKEEYDKWIRDFIAQFQGAAYFMQGREKMPYTLQNLVDATNTAVRGQQNLLTFGPNQAKAYGIKQFKSIDEIKRSENKLVSNERMKEVDEENKRIFFDLAESLNYAYPDNFDKLSSLGKALADYYKGNSPATALIRNDFKKPSADQIELFVSVADSIKSSPVDYFEAKYQRAVDLGEFTYAIVPKTTGKDVITILKDKGLVVKRYDNEEDRIRMTNEIVEKDKRLKFRHGGEIGSLQKDNDMDGSDKSKRIMLPDTEASYESIKRVLNQQGYDISPQRPDIGRLAVGMTLEDLAAKHSVEVSELRAELDRGIETEMEHTTDREIAKAIAMDHLYESPTYYTKLKNMESTQRYAMGGGLPIPAMDFGFATPTGRPSKLNLAQQALVRTSKFKDFFGDWETAARNFIADGMQNMDKHYQNCSVVIEIDTLEPRIMYHGTRTDMEFFEFDITEKGRERARSRPYGYFAYNPEYSRNFTLTSQRRSGNVPYLYQCFLNVRKPFYALGPEYDTVVADINHWAEKIAERITLDHTQNKPQSFIDSRKLQNRQIVLDKLQNMVGLPQSRFWQYMSTDSDSGFKYFLHSYKYDAIIYYENFTEPYDENDPSQYTKAIAVFNPNQIKLADGRNTDFDKFKNDMRYEDGGKTESNMIPAGKDTFTKMDRLEQTLFPFKYAQGGEVQGHGLKDGDDGKRGGYLVGRSHAEGGIKAFNVSTGKPLEVEGNEVIIAKNAVMDETKRMFEGEMLTNREILSRINVSGGGVSFEHGGKMETCNCTGRKYNYGGMLLDDYDILRYMSDPMGIVHRVNRDALTFADRLVAIMK